MLMPNCRPSTRQVYVAHIQSASVAPSRPGTKQTRGCTGSAAITDPELFPRPDDGPCPPPVRPAQPCRSAGLAPQNCHVLVRSNPGSGPAHGRPAPGGAPGGGRCCGTGERVTYSELTQFVVMYPLQPGGVHIRQRARAPAHCHAPCEIGSKGQRQGMLDRSCLPRNCLGNPRTIMGR